MNALAGKGLMKMDIGAYIIKEHKEINDFIKKLVGNIPRERCVRFMRLELPNEGQPEMFRKHCGKDVVYIHTRCGVCHPNTIEDPDCNYNYCGGKDFEERNKAIFIESEDDEFDGTYRDHYFKISEKMKNEYMRILQIILDYNSPR